MQEYINYYYAIFLIYLISNLLSLKVLYLVTIIIIKRMNEFIYNILIYILSAY